MNKNVNQKVELSDEELQYVLETVVFSVCPDACWDMNEDNTKVAMGILEKFAAVKMRARDDLHIFGDDFEDREVSEKIINLKLARNKLV
jgi:hypothetical protein